MARVYRFWTWPAVLGESGEEDRSFLTEHNHWLVYEFRIWLTDISRILPSSAVLVGTDVSLDQCPPKAWLASNVSLQSWSIFDEPPDNLIGRFDLVHLRFLNFVIKDNEITSTLLRVMKTLSKFLLAQNLLDRIVRTSKEIVHTDPFGQRKADGFSGASTIIQAIRL